MCADACLLVQALIIYVYTKKAATPIPTGFAAFLSLIVDTVSPLLYNYY